MDTKGNRAVSHCPRAVAWHPSFAEASSVARMILRSNHGIMPVLKRAISTAFKALGFFELKHATSLLLSAII